MEGHNYTGAPARQMQQTSNPLSPGHAEPPMKIDCDCKMQCTYMMAKTPKNNGRWFYRCHDCKDLCFACIQNTATSLQSIGVTCCKHCADLHMQLVIPLAFVKAISFDPMHVRLCVYRCPRRDEGQCKFFKWADEVSQQQPSPSRTLYKYFLQMLRSNKQGLYRL